MFTHMALVQKEVHSARDSSFEVAVYQVQGSGEYRIYISKDGFGTGHIHTASQEVVTDASLAGINMVSSLIEAAKDDINKNEFGEY